MPPLLEVLDDLIDGELRRDIAAQATTARRRRTAAFVRNLDAQTWETMARECGLSPRDRRRIAQVLVENRGRSIPKLRTSIRVALAESPTSRWHTFDKAVIPYERKATKQLRAWFTSQGRRIVAGISRQPHLLEALRSDDWWAASFLAELETELAQILAEVIEPFGESMSVRLGRDPFDPQQQRVTDYIRNRSATVSRYVNDTTQQAVKDMIAQGEASGLGIDEIARSVRGYFEGSASKAAYRAELAARWEVISASNFAAIEGAKQAGAQTKEWLIAGDDQVCPECEALDGESVGLAEMFSSGDEYPPAHGNCRCAVQVDAGDGTVEMAGDE